MNDTTDKPRLYQVALDDEATKFSDPLPAQAAVEAFADRRNYAVGEVFHGGTIEMITEDGDFVNNGATYDELADNIATDDARVSKANGLAVEFRAYEGPERTPDPTPPRDGGADDHAEDFALLRGLDPASNIAELIKGEDAQYGRDQVGPIGNALFAVWPEASAEHYPATVGEFLDFLDGPANDGDDDPNKPRGKGPEPQTESKEGAFVLIERSASGNQETGMTAHLYTDRDAATESARGFPMSQEDAARQGQTTWAEVHPVTAHFAANFQMMQDAGRLDSIAALYSTVREVDGHLVPAGMWEPKAIAGDLREGDAGEASPYGGEPTRPQHMRAAIASRPTPGGTETTANAFYHAGENPAAKEVRAATNENAHAAPVDDVSAWRAQRLHDEVAAFDGPLPPQPSTADRGADHYAVLKAETPESGQQMRADLAVMADSRDVDGDAPAQREILSRTNAESSARQDAELSASHGAEKADAPMTGREKFADLLARADREVTAREAREDEGQDAAPMRAAGGRGPSIG